MALGMLSAYESGIPVTDTLPLQLTTTVGGESLCLEALADGMLDTKPCATVSAAQAFEYTLETRMLRDGQQRCMEFFSPKFGWNHARLSSCRAEAGASGQRWKLKEVGAGAGFQIISESNDKCLEAGGRTRFRGRPRVFFVDCNKKSEESIWGFVSPSQS